MRNLSPSLRAITNGYERRLIRLTELSEVEQNEQYEKYGLYAEEWDYFRYKGRLLCLIDFLMNNSNSFNDARGLWHIGTVNTGLCVCISENFTHVTVGLVVNDASLVEQTRKAPDGLRPSEKVRTNGFLSNPMNQGQMAV